MIETQARAEARKAKFFRKWMGISMQSEIRPLTLTVLEDEVRITCPEREEPLVKMTIEDFELVDANEIVDVINRSNT